MNLTLEITLLSPLSAGSGMGKPGEVDREVVFDPLGVPMIPGKRLKGLLRDGYREVGEAVGGAGLADLPPMEAIFGQPGQEQGGPLTVGNGSLSEAEDLGEWLTWLEEERGGVSAAEVRGFYTETRFQTSIDRESGAAAENTLRSTRMVRRGLVFRAPLRWAGQEDQVRAVALACAAVRGMGTGRTRGLGKVRWRLLDGEQDLTVKALDKLRDGAWPAAQPGGAAALNQKNPPVGPAESTETSGGEPTHFIRYRLRLRAGAVFPRLGGDQNTVLTERFVPGPAVRGAVAWRYLKVNGPEPDGEFERLFLDGHLRFLPAYPEDQDEGGRRLLPIPLSVRRDKENEKCAYDRAAGDGEQAPSVRVEGFGRHDGGDWRRQRVETVLALHHARAKDRRYGRALGEEEAKKAGLEPETRGALFTYEALAPGQSFIGVVLGQEKDLRLFESFVAGVEEMAFGLGRSRGAQYGGQTEVEFLGGVEALGEKDEWEGWVKKQKGYPDLDAEDGVRGNDGKLVVTMASPLLAVNEWGHPAPRFPKEELAQLLGLAADSLEEKASFARVQWVGGYQSHLRLPRPQWPALAAGSVFVFQVRGGELPPPETLRKAEAAGVGLRCEEGFGRFVLNRHGYRRQGRWEDGDGDHRKKAKPAGNVPDEVARLCKRVLLERALVLARQSGRQTAGGVELSASLLGRLSLMLRQNVSLGEKKQKLGTLRKPAKAQMNRTLVHLEDQVRATLFDHFAGGADAFGENFLKIVWNKADDSFRKACPEEALGQLAAAKGEMVTRVYLETVLREMQLNLRIKERKKQSEGNPAGGEGA